MQDLKSGAMDPKDALLFEHKNDLLDPGYHTRETGYCFMPDNSCYVAVLTNMPGVTAEMLDWWFCWNALEALCYKSWYSGAHVAVHAKNTAQLQNPALSFRERYWKNPHYPVEDVGIGMEMLSITFLPPEDFGFNTSQFFEFRIVTTVCARGGSVAKKLLHTDMCHVVRATEDGVEMRSRFWIGRNLCFTPLSERSPVQRLINTRFVRKILIPRDTPAKVAHHCAQEYTNLAAILSDLYRDYGGVESKERGGR
jgi:phloretin hydrolase